jgi:hypothetical protein
MNNLNSYNEKEFEQKFSTTEIYQRLTNDFDIVCFGGNYNYDDFRGTPREWYGSNCRRTIFSAISFYYLEYLTRHNPSKIYDIGCGWNIFAKYIPNIIGLSGEPPDSINFHGDDHAFVNAQYIKKHQEYFESAFSINALHYVNLTTIRQRVLDIVSMITTGGRIFLAFNLNIMLQNDPNFYGWNIDKIETWIREQLDNMPFTYEVFDIDFSQKKDDWMNGNIRLLIWRKTT